MSQNECVCVGSSHAGITSNAFDGGCLFSQDCSFSFEDGTFNDNSGDFILSFSRRKDSINVGAVLYHSYPNKPSYDIMVFNSRIIQVHQVNIQMKMILKVMI